VKAISEATRLLREETKRENAELKDFELYTLRHTCLTQWAPHMDPWTLAYLAGHRDMNITKRYVHPQRANDSRRYGKGRNCKEWAYFWAYRFFGARFVRSSSDCIELTGWDLSGAPGLTRTADLLVRSQTLYPTELRAREVHYSNRALSFECGLHDPDASAFPAIRRCFRTGPRPKSPLPIDPAAGSNRNISRHPRCRALASRR
jgi:hypothetical protein